MKFIKKNRHEIALFAIFATAFFLRLFFMLNVQTVQVYDFANYQMVAQNIALGYGHSMRGLPVAWQGSGYPLILGAFYWLIGSTDEFFGKLFNLFFSMGTLVFCWFIFKKIFSKKNSALAALGIAAVLPQYVAYVNVLGTEVLFTFFLAGAVFFTLYFSEKKWAFAAIGVFIALAALTRPFMLAYPVIVGVFLYSQSKELKKSLIFTAMCFVAMCLVVAPWTIRNFRQFDRFIPVSYNSGYVLFINNNDVNVTGFWIDHLRVTAPHPERHAILLAAHEYNDRTIHQLHEVEPYFDEWAREWIRQNPLQYLQMGVLRLYRTFFDGANDIPQWAANVRPYHRYYLSEAEQARFRRSQNFFEATADMFTWVLNSAAFLFMFASLKKYCVAFFTRNGQMDLHTAVVFLNIAFFVVVTFLFEGQARYAFPVFIFIIPAAMKVGEAVQKNVC